MLTSLDSRKKDYSYNGVFERLNNKQHWLKQSISIDKNMLWFFFFKFILTFGLSNTLELLEMFGSQGSLTCYESLTCKLSTLYCIHTIVRNEVWDNDRVHRSLSNVLISKCFFLFFFFSPAHSNGKTHFSKQWPL